MTKLKQIMQRFPMAFAVAFGVVTYWLMVGIEKWIRLAPPSLFTDLASELVHIAWPIVVVVLLGYGFVFTAKGFGKTLKAGWGCLAFYGFAACLVVLLAVTDENTKWQSWDKIAIGLLTMIGIGIREELLFRGVIGNVLAFKYARSVKGLWITVLASSLIFGFIHMFNMFSGVTFGGAFVQSLGAFGIGMIFMAIYLRGGNLWLLAVVHAVIDFAGLFKSTFLIAGVSGTDEINTLDIKGPIIVIPLGIAVTFFLFRKSKRQEIFDRLDALRAKHGY